MSISKTNPISGHQLTLMPPTPAAPEPFGWIRLLNGAADAGYIYLQTPPVVPRLNSTGDYIVSSMPISLLPTLLSIFDSGAKLQIRFFDPQSAGVMPSVFIETDPDAIGTPTNPLNVPDEIAEEISALR